MTPDEALSERDLEVIEQRAGAATPGPWFVRHLDDDYAAGLTAVSTVPDTGRHEGWPRFDGAEIVAATIVQNPCAYAVVADGKWDQNADFIAHAREDVPSLVAEIRRLRQLVEGGQPND